MTNLNNDIGKFFIFGGITIAVAQTSLAYGQFISVAAPTNAASTDLAGPLTVPMMIFSGYFINNASIPKYFLWLKYLSWFGYANEALVINQWSGVKNIKCDTYEALCFLNGEAIIDYLNINVVSSLSLSSSYKSSSRKLNPNSISNNKKRTISTTMLSCSWC